MRVMITGATGFVGYHTACELIEAGHDVSLLVRSAAKMRRVFGDLPVASYTEADMTDEEGVRQAMFGCDGVVHVAALVSTHAADRKKVLETNVAGVRNVIGQALALGIDNIIHVSSVTALYDPQLTVLTEDSALGSGEGGYGESKVACERYVRSLQGPDNRLTITYPATVLGPDSPEMTEAHTGVQTYLRAFVPMMSSGTQYIDVRDIARVHRLILEGVAPSNRYVLGGHYLSWREHPGFLRQLTGRRPLAIPLNGSLMRLAGRVADRVVPILGKDTPLTAEGLTYATGWILMDNSRVLRELDFEFRPLEVTFKDTIRWLHGAGELNARETGLLAS
ncbi:SDR family NAD(P)-dependent oxidoreductase [Halioglobus maricola]|uniref:SDR family NAD(P)-dependent oxidoreductase n=1 Tax=Halioglobus maricola TaxID=2601894 RepID=A0A5P9NL61_9GAMM|nr:SDR family NAD(P)-dependent oxidoreductase [Halioglobus maricola]QFU75678.1 SDR family NAD(P)-dependent oxidoreductase [Halioglobus maricola]